MYIQHHEGLVLSSDSWVRYVDVLQCRVGGAYVFQHISINLLPGLYIQAQQLDGDLPHDGAEEVGVPAEENFGLVGRFFGTLSTFTPGFQIPIHQFVKHHCYNFGQTSFYIL